MHLTYKMCLKKYLIKKLIAEIIACEKALPAWSFRHRNTIIEILKECWISGQGHLVNSVKAECTSGNHVGQRIRRTAPLSLALLLSRHVTSAMPLHFLVLLIFF